MIRGVIFDLDGTLLDSNSCWDEAPAVWLAGIGVRAKPELSRTIFPMTLPEAADFMIADYALTQTRQELMEGVNAVMERFYLREAPLKPGVPALLEALRRRGLPLMVASVTDKSLVEAALARHGVLNLFRGIVTTEEAGAGKQRPDVYLRSAERLGSAPEETLVFEDAPHALKTAARAGFRTVGIYDPVHAGAQEELRAAADFYLESFLDLSALLEAVDSGRL